GCCSIRDLYSFPTRRSSDLGAQIIRIGFSEFSEVSTCSQLLTHFSNLGFIIILYKNVRRFPLSLRLERCYILFKLLTSLFLTYLDRKSTRLNSSHVKISYAV